MKSIIKDGSRRLPLFVLLSYKLKRSWGVTSLMSWQGAVVSVGYFGPKSMYENDIWPFNNPNKRSMFPDNIFGNRTSAESWELLKKHSWLGIFD